MTTWSPGSSVRSTASSAAKPLEKARPRAAPSREARPSSSACRVGLPLREYSTRQALEECLASLEGAARGLAFSSGLAAEDAVLRTLDPGDHVVIPDDAYGGTFRLVARVHERHGIAWTACDLRDPAALA